MNIVRQPRTSLVRGRNAGAGTDAGCQASATLGPLGSFNSHHRRTLELILQEGFLFFKHQTHGPQGPSSKGVVV